MKNISQKSVRVFLAAFLCCTLGMSAQTKVQKYKNTFKTNKDVSVNIDTRHTTIVFENWNKNEVEVEAFLETKNQKNSNAALEKWKLDVNGNGNEVRIYSAGVVGGDQMAFAPMPPMEGFAEMMEPLMEGLRPMLEGLAQEPLPPQFYENMGSLTFDYTAYEKDGEAYMKKWEKEVEKKLGKDFEKDMQAWSKKIEEKAEKMSKGLEQKLQDWEKEHAKDIEAWGEKFGKEMEAWGAQFSQQMGAAMNGENAVLESRGNAEGKRTIIVRMPKDGILNINVRHGEVKLAELTKNMRANLSHSMLTGNTIDGAQTAINASYAPVLIKNWNYGVLNTRYVKNCTLENVKSIKLSSNASEVTIHQLSETGILSGTFGRLNINKLAPKFQTLQINLENSNLVLQLPDAPLNFNYNGSQSSIKYPVGLKAKPVRSYDSELLNGFYKSNDADNSISIKAKYSEVLVK